MKKYVGLVVLVFLVIAMPVYAEIFKWTDGGGTVHFTDDRAGIPLKYKKKAVSVGGDGDESPAVVHKAKPAPMVVDLGTRRDDLPRREAADQSELGVLARSLMQNASTDREKAYAIFNWIHANIYYDNATKWQRRYGNSGADQSPEGVLKSKKAVCAGMANLYAALAGKMGLQSVVIGGIASGMHQEAHAWNAVMVDGKWELLDLTRHTFLAPPQEFIARHFPNDPRWQLLDKPLTYQEWLKR